MEGILKLFASDGSEIAASTKDLLKLEARSKSGRLYRRLFADTNGTYWLLSARPGHVRMILEINVYEGYELSWCTNGIADYEHWTVEGAVKALANRQLPANVEELVRKHVYYVPGVKGNDSDAPRPQFALNTVSASEAKRRLAKVTDVDTSELVTTYAGRQVEIIELMLALTFFCEENKAAAGKEMALARALTRQHLKLFWLTLRLGAQLSQG